MATMTIQWQSNYSDNYKFFIIMSVVIHKNTNLIFNKQTYTPLGQKKKNRISKPALTCSKSTMEILE